MDRSHLISFRIPLTRTLLSFSLYHLAGIQRAHYRPTLDILHGQLIRTKLSRNYVRRALLVRDVYLEVTKFFSLPVFSRRTELDSLVGRKSNERVRQRSSRGLFDNPSRGCTRWRCSIKWCARARIMNRSVRVWCLRAKELCFIPPWTTRDVRRDEDARSSRIITSRIRCVTNAGGGLSLDQSFCEPATNYIGRSVSTYDLLDSFLLRA